jgi:hypothetical protein
VRHVALYLLMSLTMSGCYDRYVVDRGLVDRARVVPPDVPVGIAAERQDGAPVYVRRQSLERATPDASGRVRLCKRLGTAGAVALIVAVPTITTGAVILGTTTPDPWKLYWPTILAGTFMTIGIVSAVVGLVLTMVDAGRHPHEVREARPGTVYVGGDGALHF